jgi:hypothetical protein
MLYGWISAESSDRRLLTGLGIKLGRYDGSRYVDCIVPDEAVEGLRELAQMFPPRALFLLDEVEEVEVTQ